jgi:hypothetical protein
MKWPSRLAAALAEVVGGALVGLALSLTQDSHVHRWPWLIVGGVVALIVGLVIAEVIMQRGSADESETPRPAGVSIFAGKIVNSETGKILASGPGSFVELVSNDVANSGVIRTDEGDAADATS